MANNFENKDFNDFWEMFRDEKFQDVMGKANEFTEPLRRGDKSDPAYFGNQIASIAFNIAFWTLREYHEWITSPSEKTQP